MRTLCTMCATRTEGPAGANANYAATSRRHRHLVRVHQIRDEVPDQRLAERLEQSLGHLAERGRLAFADSGVTRARAAASR